jgi:hypothetical protein
VALPTLSLLIWTRASQAHGFKLNDVQLRDTIQTLTGSDLVRYACAPYIEARERIRLLETEVRAIKCVATDFI